jgi:hypothetical protein
MQLESLKRNMKNFVHFTYKKIQVFDPYQELRPLSNDEIWEENPTNPRPEAMGRIVDSLVRVVNSMTSSSGSREGTKQIRGLKAEARPTTAATTHTTMREEEWDIIRGNRAAYDGDRHFDPAHSYGGRDSRGGHRNYTCRSRSTRVDFTRICSHW